VAFLASVRTLTTLVVLSLYILLTGPPVLLWTLLSRNPRALYAVGDAGVRLAFALVGIRVQVAGEVNIDLGRAAVYAANHSSNIDPPAVFTALSRLHPRLRTIYKAELRKLPVLVWAFDAAGFVPIERANRDQSLPAVDRATASLAAGNSFFIFPEGTRSRTGELLPFKKGGFLMAIGAQVPVVPVTVSGGRDAMRKGSPIIHPVTVMVDFGSPIPTAGMTAEDRDVLIGRVRAAMDARLPRKSL
jgi:1-acyl-sn-glycerol-3-phosphate acyltransferase